MAFIRFLLAASLTVTLFGIYSIPSAQAQDLPCNDHPACQAAPTQDKLCRIYLDAPRGAVLFCPPT